MHRVKPLKLHAAPIRAALLLILYWVLAVPQMAHASFLEGEALDNLADVMSWIIIFIVPAVCIAVFWLVHILPEKVAEKRKHPQAKAIQCLCLLSLFFGGLLWPIAWLWAYSKPVLYKMAYGTDKEEHDPPPDKIDPEPAPAVVAETKTKAKKEGGQS